MEKCAWLRNRDARVALMQRKHNYLAWDLAEVSIFAMLQHFQLGLCFSFQRLSSNLFPVLPISRRQTRRSITNTVYKHKGQFSCFPSQTLLVFLTCLRSINAHACVGTVNNQKRCCMLQIDQANRDPVNRYPMIDREHPNYMQQ
ncbi:hypothetical protein WN48_07369 [Eufriesea mexicana]|nr:hypothetical protein WN48_07369 [Eufriesea mexicana]